MIRIIVLAGCLLLVGVGAFAQAGSFRVYADSARCDCDPDNTSGFMLVHVIHENTPGATACQFSVEIIGTVLSWLGDYSYFSTIGDTQNGIAVAYGECMASPIHVVRVMYMGTSQPCDMIRIVADPTSVQPGIWVTDCATPVPNRLPGYGGVTYINSIMEQCYNCSPYYDPPWCTVPAEETSWGQVKELYK